MARLIAEGRSVMIQPYLERVDEQGETALVYINGEFSHAIGKGAVLSRGHAPTLALFAPEEIIARTAGPEELELGARVLGQLPFGTFCTRASICCAMPAGYRAYWNSNSPNHRST